VGGSPRLRLHRLVGRARRGPAGGQLSRLRPGEAARLADLAHWAP
jgi:hypothetical protein